MVNCMECIHIDVCIKAATSHIDHCDDYSFAGNTVEVVRCRDCKWYMPGDLFTDIMFCHRLKKYNVKPAKYNYCADDFCSYGERKAGAD